MPPRRAKKARAEPKDTQWIATLQCRQSEYDLVGLRPVRPGKAVELAPAQPLKLTNSAGQAVYGVQFEAAVQILARRPPYVAWLQRRELSGFREYRVVLLADGREPTADNWQSIRLRSVKLV